MFFTLILQDTGETCCVALSSTHSLHKLKVVKLNSVNLFGKVVISSSSQSDWRRRRNYYFTSEFARVKLHNFKHYEVKFKDRKEEDRSFFCACSIFSRIQPVQKYPSLNLGGLSNPQGDAQGFERGQERGARSCLSTLEIEPRTPTVKLN